MCHSRWNKGGGIGSGKGKVTNKYLFSIYSASHGAKDHDQLMRRISFFSYYYDDEYDAVSCATWNCPGRKHIEQ
jgi:hypothetical protein